MAEGIRRSIIAEDAYPLFDVFVYFLRDVEAIQEAGHELPLFRRLFYTKPALCIEAEESAALLKSDGCVQVSAA